MPNQLAHSTKTEANVSLCWESVLGPADLIVMDMTDEEEGAHVAAVPEMTGDLLSTALSWVCALFIVNFTVLLIKASTPPS